MEDEENVSTPSSACPAREVSTRRTRFVCVSDTHNHNVKLPTGDVLIHAGDLTNQGSYSEVSTGLCLLRSYSANGNV